MKLTISQDPQAGDPCSKLWMYTDCDDEIELERFIINSLVQNRPCEGTFVTKNAKKIPQAWKQPFDITLSTATFTYQLKDVVLILIQLNGLPTQEIIYNWKAQNLSW